MSKTLIISHNPITTYESMGKTLLQLFSSFRSEELCQLYIYPTLPDIARCHSYFRITDKDVLKSYTSFLQVKGREIRGEEITPGARALFEHPEDEKLYRNTKNKRPFRMLLRDAMWKCAHWNNRALKQWLEREAPDRIFVAPGAATFLYEIAIKISTRYRLPMAVYLCDEYYFVRRPDAWLGRIQLSLRRRSMQKLIYRSAHIVTICGELEESYARHFRRPTTTIMTGTSRPIADAPKTCPAPQRIVYAGSIRCNRYTALAEIGHALDRFNAGYGTQFRLAVYTQEKNTEILRSLQGIQSLELCGFLTGEAFERVFASADLLLHVEAFDAQSIDRVRHSVSTKIADSLGSGSCLLAYAPDCVASMRHLLKHRCALTATEPDKLPEMLESAFFREKERKTVVENALRTARQEHDAGRTSARLYQIMEGLHEGFTDQLCVQNRKHRKNCL